MKTAATLVPAFVLALALGACRTPDWNGRVARWGSMREVMREGRTEARVPLAAAVRSPATVGIGALAGLNGEIAIVDGVAWVARTDGGGLECGSGVRPDESATLLATAEVRGWSVLQLDRDVAAADLELLLASVGEQAGFPRTQAWPFVIEGELFGVEAHVLRGQCPFAGALDAEHEPLRRSFASVHGRLIGFYAPDAPGELVHHGQASHTHVVIEHPSVFVGHVDSVGVRAGARLSIPAPR